MGQKVQQMSKKTEKIGQKISTWLTNLIRLVEKSEQVGYSSNMNGEIYPKLLLKNIYKLWINNHLTFTRWKTVSVPAPICPTSDRDTCSIAVI